MNTEVIIVDIRGEYWGYYCGMLEVNTEVIIVDIRGEHWGYYCGMLEVNTKVIIVDIRGEHCGYYCGMLEVNTEVIIMDITCEYWGYYCGMLEVNTEVVIVDFIGEYWGYNCGMLEVNTEVIIVGCLPKTMVGSYRRFGRNIHFVCMVERKKTNTEDRRNMLVFQSLNDFIPNYRASMLQYRNVNLKYVLLLRTKRFIYTLPCYLLESIFQFIL